MAPLFFDTQDQIVLEWRRKGLESTKWFAHHFMPDSIQPERHTAQHDVIFDLIDDDTIPKAAICGRRKLGKTTTFMAASIRRIIYRLSYFLTYTASDFEKKACSQTDNWMQELIGNQLIREVYGNFKPKNGEDVRLSFGKSSWYACDPVTGEPIAYVLPVGVRQNPRGFNKRIAGRIRRPDWNCLDDFESDEDVLNVDTLDKIWDWFFGSYLPITDDVYPSARTGRWIRPDTIEARANWRAPWRWIFIDNLKGNKTTIDRVSQLSDWEYREIPMAKEEVDETGKSNLVSLVPEIVTTEQVRKEAANYKEAGQYHIFVREFLCKNVPPGSLGFKKEWLRYYPDNIEKQIDEAPGHVLTRAIIVDPNRSSGMRACDYSILSLAAGFFRGVMDKNVILFRDLICKQIPEEEKFDALFDACISHNTRVVALEIIGMSDSDRALYRNEAERRGLAIEWMFLTGHTGMPSHSGEFGQGRDAIKRARFSQIIPYYASGTVYHSSRLKDSAYERTILRYPFCTKWDGPDTAGYSPRVLQERGVYFEAEVDADKPVRNFREPDDGRYAESESVTQAPWGGWEPVYA